MHAADLGSFLDKLFGCSETDSRAVAAGYGEQRVKNDAEISLLSTGHYYHLSVKVRDLGVGVESGATREEIRKHHRADRGK